jgi:hypothetical protein
VQSLLSDRTKNRKKLDDLALSTQIYVLRCIPQADEIVLRQVTLESSQGVLKPHRSVEAEDVC